MFFDFPSVGEVVCFFGFVGGLLLTVLGSILKLCGVLLLSWWWILCPVPAFILLLVFILGVITLLA